MARQLLTPSPSPPPAVPTPKLPTQINAATREQRIKLKRLIVARLPLALPPNATEPALFGLGLAAFARVYHAFEAAWEQKACDSVAENSLTGTHDVQVQRWLATLRPEGLSRSSRLKDDLRYVCWRIGANTKAKTSAQQITWDQMRSEILAKPHILTAYGWVMYMAIFSGGRWMRQQLSNAGLEFWTGQPDYMPREKDELLLLQLPGFSFLSFEGQQDGEDIKALFKARIAEAETLLTQQERQDVITAAQGLFEDCIDLVAILDRAIWWQAVRQRIAVILLGITGTLTLLYLLVKQSWAHALDILSTCIGQCWTQRMALKVF